MTSTEQQGRKGPGRVDLAELFSDEGAAKAPDGRLLARKSGIYAVGEAVLGTSQLATAIILTRALDKPTFAQISLILLMYSSALSIGGFNLAQSVFYFFGRLNRARQKRFVIHTGEILLVLGVVIGLGLLALGPVVESWGYPLTGRMAILTLVVMLELPAQPLANVLLARGRAVHAAVVNILTGVGQMGAIVLPLLLGQGIDGSLLGLVFYALARLTLHLAAVRWLFPVRAARMDWRLVRAQVRYTLPLGLAMLTGMLNRQIDKYLVAAFLPPTDFSAYVIGAQEIPLITVLPYAVGAVLMVPFVRGYLAGDRASLLKLWHDAVSRVSLVVVPLVVLAILLADELVVALFSSAYRDSALPFRIYTIILFHRVAEYGLVLRSTGDTRALWVASGILLVGNLAFSVPLVLLLGMPGPALGTLLANIPAWLYVLHRIGRALDAPWSAVFPWRRYAGVLGVSVLAALPVAPMVFLLDWPPVMAIALAILGFVSVYAALLYVTRLARWREIGDLLRIRPRTR